MEFTIERDTRPRITLEEFRDGYRLRPRGTRVQYGQGWRCRIEWLVSSLKRCDIYGIGFALRIRAGDAAGYFGPTSREARWCWPWQWARLYYAARFPE